ncbi:hypothetical protein GDO81_017257 [Engystomops pustulosus]|uniref:Methyltransferase domain-containing protein n=1 Tax=Engystomops pustulosus TaxID=76066 RepID=A0AAV7AI91_ENGPU|nr:hypothetical protein GDO81_017257 [Engystomops pustulosus]KAG8559161.1 hypothetical protein GDO81_017257 [Engystomops pustulosus]
MAAQVFNTMPFSLLYHKYMIPVSNEVTSMVLSYVEEKTNGRPLDMALDVGCGTGRYTLPLAPHFKKVLGIDICDSQINVAKRYNTANNVSYMVASAERLPVENNSVDLVWNLMWQQSTTPDLTQTGAHMLDQFQTLYEAIPLKDKKWVKDIPVKFQVSVPEIIGFIQSICVFQIYLEKNEKEAKQFLAQTEERMRDVLGEEADSARLNLHMKHYCVLACKH